MQNCNKIPTNTHQEYIKKIIFYGQSEVYYKNARLIQHSNIDQCNSAYQQTKQKNIHDHFHICREKKEFNKIQHQHMEKALKKLIYIQPDKWCVYIKQPQEIYSKIKTETVIFLYLAFPFDQFRVCMSLLKLSTCSPKIRNKIRLSILTTPIQYSNWKFQPEKCDLAMLLERHSKRCP